jgi:hypothetical protein
MRGCLSKAWNRDKAVEVTLERQVRDRSHINHSSINSLNLRQGLVYTRTETLDPGSSNAAGSSELLGQTIFLQDIARVWTLRV